LWKKRIWRNYITFDKFVVWSWNEDLSFGERCDVTLEMREWLGNVFCIHVLSQWKLVKKPLCVLCGFILLEYEER
jgi:hypothetical protein